MAVPSGVTTVVPVRGDCSAPNRSRSTSAVSVSAAGSRSIRSASSADSRCCGSLTSSPAMRSASTPALPGGSSGSSAMAYAVSIAVGRRNGEMPSTAWYRVAPSAHRSDSGPGRTPRIRSGLRKSMEPMSSPVRVRVEVPDAWAMPKSVRTIRESSPSSTLPGFTSRCSTPARWAARSAATMPRPTRAASAGSNGPCALSRSPRVTEGTYSITIDGSPASSTTSCTTTTLGWLIRAAARASRLVRSKRVAISSSSMCGCGGCSFFTATRRPRSSSSASHTVPIPPRPMRSSSR